MVYLCVFVLVFVCARLSQMSLHILFVTLNRCHSSIAQLSNTGDDLGKEHERFLAEEIIKGPVFVTNYPRSIKPFYMRRDEDVDSSLGSRGETVAAVDLILPDIGEVVGGGQREERLDVLVGSMHDAGLCNSDGSGAGSLDWYVDLRRYGSVPHAGFGLGFDRYLQFITGMHNIRDV